MQYLSGINKICISIEHLLYESDCNSIKTYKMNTLGHAIGEHYVRLLEKYKIILFLNQDCLEIRLYLNQKHSHFFRGMFWYEHLPMVFKSVFEDLCEIFVEFKAIKEDQIFFTDNKELIYCIPLATKRLELPFPLAQVPLNRLEQLLLDNQVLERIKGDYQVILRQKDKEISDLKRELSDYKAALLRISTTNNKNQANLTSQIQTRPIQLHLTDSSSYQNALRINQTQAYHQKQGLKRTKNGNSLWSLPSAKYFKDTEGNIKRLTKMPQQQFNFFISKDAKYIQHFQFRNSRLKLLKDADVEPYRVFPIDKFDSDHRNIFGMRLINQNSSLIRIGIICLKDDVHTEGQSVDQWIYYDLKAGMSQACTQNGRVKINLVPVKVNDTIHMTITPGQGSMGWYHNQLLVKEVRLAGSFVRSSLIPYVQMSAEGDEIEFL